eukprot:10914-Heterococcus_DN1.PRE.1
MSMDVSATDFKMQEYTSYCLLHSSDVIYTKHSSHSSSVVSKICAIHSSTVCTAASLQSAMFIMQMNHANASKLLDGARQR